MKKVLFIIAFIFFFNDLFAGLSVDPAVTNVKIKPSKQYKGEYSVTNTYTKPIDITIEIEDWNSFNGNEGLTVQDWFQIENTAYALAAGQTITIPYTVSIKDNLKGSISARLTFFVDKNKQNLIVSVSVPLYVTVSGTEILDFDIENISLFNENGNILFKADIINKGNIHIRPSFYAEIYDYKKEKLIKKVNIPEELPVYAQKTRQLQNKLFSNTDLQKGKYHLVLKTRALTKEITKELTFKLSEEGTITFNTL
ncbi:hypothetical protein [Candidatus Ruminimicrobium bovinum]|uniref:hypothetical protein n=1 Tax=Candidatus Ruminimicrobium bovinum TaxID=3242779 RepID=UPI0039B82EA5